MSYCEAKVEVKSRANKVWPAITAHRASTEPIDESDPNPYRYR